MSTQLFAVAGGKLMYGADEDHDDLQWRVEWTRQCLMRSGGTPVCRDQRAFGTKESAVAYQHTCHATSGVHPLLPEVVGLYEDDTEWIEGDFRRAINWAVDARRRPLRRDEDSVSDRPDVPDYYGQASCRHED